MNDIDPKLLKIIALAKGGIGGEKEAAIELVRKICLREGLDFDDVMSDRNAPKEYTHEFKVQSVDELQIAIQVAARFASTIEHPNVNGGRYRNYKSLRWIKYTTTASQHIDTINAIEVYLQAYRKEKRNIARSLGRAFVSHHGLYQSYSEPESDTPEPPRPPKTAQQRADDYRAMQLTQAMTESVNVTKQIGGGSGE